MGKIFGSLLNRIDTHIELPSIKHKELTDTRKAEPSRVIKERVEKAGAIQRKRFKAEGIFYIFYNSRVSTKLVKKYCMLGNGGKRIAKDGDDGTWVIGETYDKIPKVARTIADLEEKETIESGHISEAVGYRSLDRNLWV